jgi:hypothetical protein
MADGAARERAADVDRLSVGDTEATDDTDRSEQCVRVLPAAVLQLLLTSGPLTPDQHRRRELQGFAQSQRPEDPQRGTSKVGEQQAGRTILSFLNFPRHLHHSCVHAGD